MTSSKNETDQIRNDQKAGGSRTTIHVAAAAVAAGLLLIMIMAVPAWTDFMKERQTRALTQAVFVDLKMMADKQAAFHQVYGFYTTDLNAIGVTPKMVIYKVGFVKASTHEFELHADKARELNLDPGVKDLDLLKKAIPKLKMEYSPLTRLDAIDISSLASHCPDCTATATGFKAMAAANLDEDADLDIWTIDEKGQMVHVVKDVTP
jgi:hypothetical protein